MRKRKEKQREREKKQQKRKSEGGDESRVEPIGFGVIAGGLVSPSKKSIDRELCNYYEEEVDRHGVITARYCVC